MSAMIRLRPESRGGAAFRFVPLLASLRTAAKTVIHPDHERF
jgi:hypothetical protein